MQLVIDHDYLLSRQEADTYQLALKKANERFCNKACQDVMDRAARKMVFGLIECQGDLKPSFIGKVNNRRIQ